MKYIRFFLGQCKHLSLLAVLSTIILIPLNLYADKEKILIQIPLTGNLSAAGYSIKSGIELAISENKDCKLQPLFDDNQYNSQLALSSLKNFYLKDNIAALIIFGAPTSMAIKSFAEDNKIPTIALSAASQLDSNSSGYIKRVWESADSLAHLINVRVAQEKASRIALISSENDATLRIANSFLEYSKVIPVLELSVTPQETDFRSIATKIRQKNIDLVISNVLAGQHALLLSRLKEQAIDTKFIVQSSIFFDAKFRSPFPKIFDKISVVTVDDSQAAGLYAKLPSEDKSTNSVFMTALAYDAYNWLCKKTLEGWDMKSPLDIKNYSGILPAYKEVNNNSIEPALTTIEIDSLSE